MRTAKCKFVHIYLYGLLYGVHDLFMDGSILEALKVRFVWFQIWNCWSFDRMPEASHYNKIPIGTW